MRLVLVMVSCGLLSGCWQTYVADGMISTREIEIGKSGKNYRVDYSRKVWGYHRAHTFLMFRGEIINPNPQAAVDSAIDQVHDNNPAVGLSCVQLRWHWFWVPLIYSQRWYSVEGCPIFCEMTGGDESLPPKMKKEQPNPAQGNNSSGNPVNSVFYL